VRAVVVQDDVNGQLLRCVAVVLPQEPEPLSVAMLLLGNTYAFEITAVDSEGRVSPTASSQDTQH